MPACGYEFYLLVIMQLYFSLVGCAHSEISSWTLEDKISIRARACNILYIQRILLEKQADWPICQGQKLLSRVVKVCFRFYARIFSLLIKPELQSEIRSY